MIMMMMILSLFKNERDILFVRRLVPGVSDLPVYDRGCRLWCKED